MVKMEAFDDSHFMHQAVRVGHTDHTGSIVFHASLILKRIFYVTGHSYCYYSLGMVKMEAFDDSHFMQ